MNNLIIDKRLENRNILRLENYVKSRQKLRWKCLVTSCNYEWSAFASSVARPSNSKHKSSGCPRCSGKEKLDNYIVDARLQTQNRSSIIKRIGNVKKRHEKVEWNCLICNRNWFSDVGSVLSGCGCPFCAGKAPLTNEEVDRRLIGRNIIRKENILNSTDKILWECSICKFNWKARPYYLINPSNLTKHKNFGCKICSGKERISDDYIDKKLIKQGRQKELVRVSTAINNREDINWKCLSCGNFWMATPKSVLVRKSGCSNCNSSLGIRDIINQLMKYNVKFKKEVRFKDCRYKKPLPFDIAVFNEDGSIKCLIEYDGDQHFNTRFYESLGISKEESEIILNEVKLRDSIKNKYCNMKDIKLIRISYKEKHKIPFIIKQLCEVSDG